MKKLTLKEGEELVHAARNAIELTLKSPIAKKTVLYESIKDFDWPSGAFVTLSHYPLGALRGCVGFPRPSMALGKAVVDSAISAAFDDPRFVPVSFNELTDLIIEVSVLSELEPMSGSEKEKLKSIKIGRDGLMIEYGIYSGLLLPIVAVEEKWGPEEFLNAVCEKAGIPEDYWKQRNVRLYKFSTQVFKEEEPMGKVTEIK
ncbi:MAG: TIGR00296 family protein [Methanothrix sp.]